MRLIPASNFRHMEWKNGGGTSVEIAISPADANTSNFDWRVSMATINEDGWFSQFPGIDRTLIVLEGERLILSISDGTPVFLTTESEPFSFPADIPTHAQLNSKPVTDLNVMTNRARFTHQITKYQVNALTQPVRAPSIIFSPKSSLEISNGEVFVSTMEGDAILFDIDLLEITITPKNQSVFYFINFFCV